ncbi:MAG: hypothetical protein QG656_386 [Candidatus Hydrogenedentes bacterium]|nr:hypothetical protein [Candidatus Hydrogenedentota bacterium]
MGAEKNWFARGAEFALTGFVAAMGCAMVVASLVHLSAAVPTANWPTVKGRVITSGVDPASKASENLHYEYVVEGRTFSSNRVAMGLFSNVLVTNADIQRYGKQGSVTVYYRPDYPEIAVIEPGFQTGILVLLIIGFGLTVFSLNALSRGKTLSDIQRKKR